MSYIKGYRFGIIPGLDNKNLNITREIKNPTYAATLSIATAQEFTKVEESLTGAQTINAVIADTFACDELSFVFAADGTNRVVTFNTNFISAGTVTVLANKFATTKFVFSSAANMWIETGRYVEA